MSFENLDHLLNQESRFSSGEFLLFFHNDKIVATSGYHLYPTSSDVFLCGVRTYTLQEYTHHGIHSYFLLPYQFRRCWERGAKRLMFLFNDYNIKIFQYCKKLSHLVRPDPEYSLRFMDQPQMVLYQKTMQHAVFAEFIPKLKMRGGPDHVKS